MHCFTCFKIRRKVRRCTTKFSQLPHMRTSISPDPWLVYIPLNMSTCIRTFKKVCRSCESRRRHKRHNALFHLLQNASKVRRCTTKFSQLPHMRTSISPDPWLVHIPLNMSTCIRTFKKVCRSCESRRRHKRNNALFHLLQNASKSAQMYHEILPTSTHAYKYIT